MAGPSRHVGPPLTARPKGRCQEIDGIQISDWFGRHSPQIFIIQRYCLWFCDRLCWRRRSTVGLFSRPQRAGLRSRKQCAFPFQKSRARAGEPRQIKGRSPLILARAPPSLIEAVRAKAVERGVPVAVVMREALAAYVGQDTGCAA